MKWMKKRKWIRLLSVALVAGILTVGCGAKKDASGEEKTGTEKSETAKTESDATEDKTAISAWFSSVNLTPASINSFLTASVPTK